MTTKKRSRFRGTKIATVVTAAAAFAVLLAGIASGGDMGQEQAVSVASAQQAAVGTAVATPAPAKSSPPKLTAKRKSRGS
ncbi:MAG: hypothetical protein ACM3S1_08840 [Hyphomicrobiales bacterium]